MHEIARQDVILVDRNIGVGEVRAEQIVVVLDARTEEQRIDAVQPKAKSREIACALVIQTLLACSKRGNVAGIIEDRERVAVFEDRGPLGRFRRGGKNVELVVNLNYIFHSGLEARAVAGVCIIARRYTSR